MTFLESASLIGGQVLANWLAGGNVQSGVALSATASLFLSVVAIVCIVRTAKEPVKTLPLRDYSAAFYAYVLGGKGCVIVFLLLRNFFQIWFKLIFLFLIISDKRIWFLGTAQACLQFSTAVFWILWAPTIVVLINLSIFSSYLNQLSCFRNHISHDAYFHVMFKTPFDPQIWDFRLEFISKTHKNLFIIRLDSHMMIVHVWIYNVLCWVRLMGEKWIWDWYIHVSWAQECLGVQYSHGLWADNHFSGLKIA